MELEAQLDYTVLLLSKSQTGATDALKPVYGKNRLNLSMGLPHKLLEFIRTYQQVLPRYILQGMTEVMRNFVEYFQVQAVY